MSVCLSLCACVCVCVSMFASFFVLILLEYLLLLLLLLQDLAVASKAFATALLRVRDGKVRWVEWSVVEWCDVE